MSLLSNLYRPFITFSLTATMSSCAFIGPGNTKVPEAPNTDNPDDIALTEGSFSKNAEPSCTLSTPEVKEIRRNRVLAARQFTEIIDTINKLDPESEEYSNENTQEITKALEFHTKEFKRFAGQTQTAIETPCEDINSFTLSHPLSDHEVDEYLQENPTNRLSEFGRDIPELKRAWVTWHEGVMAMDDKLANEHDHGGAIPLHTLQSMGNSLKDVKFDLELVCQVISNTDNSLLRNNNETLQTTLKQSFESIR